MYENRIYIYNREKHEKITFGSEIARFDMSVMPPDFTDIFTEEKDFNIYADDGNTEITEDKYGAPLRACSVKKLEAWLAEDMKTNDYRRLKPLLAFLQALNPDEWDELVAVHFGY